MRHLKVIFAAAALFFTTYSASAQAVGFSLSGGSSTAHYSIDRYDINNRTGYHIGAGITFNVPLLTISPEVIYYNNQFDIDSPQILGRSCEVRDQRVDIPVVVGLNFLGPFTLEAGPVFSVYNEADARYYNGSPSREELGRIHPEVGYVAGVKLTLFDKVVLGARFNGQFGDYKFGYTEYDVRSYTYSFTVGYIL